MRRTDIKVGMFVALHYGSTFNKAFGFAPGPNTVLKRAKVLEIGGEPGPLGGDILVECEFYRRRDSGRWTEHVRPRDILSSWADYARARKAALR